MRTNKKIEVKKILIKKKIIKNPQKAKKNFNKLEFQLKNNEQN